MKVNIVQGNNISSNNSHKPQFEAKFSKKDLRFLIESAKYNGLYYSVYESIPQLYTMVKYLTEFPEKIARVKFSAKNPLTGNYKAISHKKAVSGDYRSVVTEIMLPDHLNYGYPIGSASDSYGPANMSFVALKNAVVKTTDKSRIAFDCCLRMPERIFEQEWWKNRHITEDDIMKLAYDA